MQKNILIKYLFLFCMMVSIILGSNQKVKASIVPAGEEQQKNYAKWVYDDATHCLTISGTGETHDEERAQGMDGSMFTQAAIPYPYGSAESATEERKRREAVREIVIEQGVTAINRAAFLDLPI